MPFPTLRLHEMEGERGKESAMFKCFLLTVCVLSAVLRVEGAVCVPPTGVAASDGTLSDKVHVTWNASPSPATHYRVYRDVRVSEEPPPALTGWIAATEYDDTTAVPVTGYVYWVAAASSSAGANASVLSEFDSGWRALAPPATVTATDGTYTDKVRITWSSVTGASHYRLYWMSKLPVALTDWQTSRSFDDTEVDPGVAHNYAVKAATDDSGTLASSFSESDSGWRALIAPTGLTASDGAGQTVEVQCDDMAGSGTGLFRFYRAETLAGPKTAICDWQINWWTYDNDGTPCVTYYYFAQRAADDSGFAASAYSLYNTGWRTLSPPTGVSAWDGLSSSIIRVTWDSMPGASHYRIHRDTWTGGTRPAISGWVAGTMFDDATAAVGQNYFYWVEAAVNSDGEHASSLSFYDSGWRCPPQPANVAATDGTYADRVTVTWDAVADAPWYRVYYAGSPGGAKTALSGWQTARTFSHTAGTPGPTYYYWVSAALDDAGSREGQLSAYDGGWRAMLPPTNVLASDGHCPTDDDPIQITWDPVVGATHYLVSRAESLGGAKTDLGTWQTATTRDDTSAATGVQYYYWVRAAINVAGLHATGYSDTDSGERFVEAWFDVRSTPVTGIWITGSSVSGWTNFGGGYCGFVHPYQLTAPRVTNIGGIDYVFIRWTGFGPPVDGQTTLTINTAGEYVLTCQYTVLGDLNEDCSVNLLDLLHVRNHLNMDPSSGGNWRYDLNADDRINLLDLIVVRNNIGHRCP